MRMTGRRTLTGASLLLLAGMLLCQLGCSMAPVKKPRAVPIGYEGEFTTWWSDAVVKERGHYLAGERHGEVERFYKDGELEFEGHFERGKRHGKLMTYHPGGTLALVENFEQDRLTGPRQLFSEKTGELVERVEYRAGSRHGMEQHWRDSGRKESEGQWQNELPVGTWRHWDPIGRLVREETYWLISGVPTGYLETVYAAGGVASVQTLMRRAGTDWEGWVTTWHENGRQQSLVENRGGARNGRDVSWDTSGRLVAEGLRKEDKRWGTWTFFGLPGDDARTTVYVDDVEVLPDAEQDLSQPEPTLDSE